MRKLNIGNSDFKKLRLNDEYYVDKSLLIKDVLDGSDVTLLPRPRRFGKTLNMTMLRYFFEKTDEDNSSLFNGLKIARDSDAMGHQGQYPVLYLSLKDVKGKSWENAFQHIAAEISQMFRAHEEILPSLPDYQSERWRILIAKKGTLADMQMSLRDIVSDLFEHYKKPVVILIDEYDSPVIDAYQNGYYDEMITFMRSWLGGGLKHVDGQAIFRAVITGILRVTRESIFSDLNNLDVLSILKPGAMVDKFGFTDDEVRQLLIDFKISSHLSETREWYNGYKFDGETIYNPWSIVNYVKGFPAPIGPQWLNTSSNTLVHRELETGGLELKRDLEKLLAGEELRYPVTEHTIFNDIGKNPQNIWSFLFFSGYLNAEDPKPKPLNRTELTYKLSIPNLEVSIVYENFVKRWQNQLEFTAIDDLIMALLDEKYPEFENLLAELIRNLLSYHDVAKYPEAAYHCFVLGLLANLRTVYDISSNPESGYGRADIIMRPKTDACHLAFVIEFKVVGTEAEMNEKSGQALGQIGEKAYISRLTEAGVDPENIRKLAIVIYGKQVAVQAVR